MSHEDKSTLNRNADKPGNSELSPNNPGRRAFIVMGASVAATYYLAGISSNAYEPGAAPSSAAPVPTAAHAITVDTTSITIGASEYL